MAAPAYALGAISGMRGTFTPSGHVSTQLTNVRPFGLRSRPSRPGGNVIVQAKKRSPVHLKYIKKSREQLEKEYLEEWMETTGVDGSDQKRMNVWTILHFAPQWIRFTLIPRPIRYLFSLIWRVVEPAWKVCHQKLLLLGAKLDAGLSRSPKGKFSKAEVLRRLHGKTSILRKVTYRVGLIMGKSLAELSKESESLASPELIPSTVGAAPATSPA